MLDLAFSQLLMQKFDVVVEASGSSQGILLAAAMTRSLGNIVFKSTCSTVGDCEGCDIRKRSK